MEARMLNSVIGVCEGDICGRQGCRGIINEHPPENCSCHINPPCSACTSPCAFCPSCEWEEKDDSLINDYRVNVNPNNGEYRTWTPRLLDETKIDWRSFSHTHSSMKKQGCYPEGTTQDDVLKKVEGTFGGRFESFGNGKFEYIAYTD